MTRRIEKELRLTRKWVLRVWLLAIVFSICAILLPYAFWYLRISLVLFFVAFLFTLSLSLERAVEEEWLIFQGNIRVYTLESIEKEQIDEFLLSLDEKSSVTHELRKKLIEFSHLFKVIKKNRFFAWKFLFTGRIPDS